MVPNIQKDRLAQVDRVFRLGLPSQALLTHYCQTVATLFGAPMAFVSLVRSDDVLFVARKGLSILSARRDSGLCSSTIHETNYHLVRDARRELRGIANALVDGEPCIRFYAGTALRPGGVAIGALAVADSSPHSAGSHELDVLLELGQLLTAEIEQNLRAAEDGLERLSRTRKEEVKGWFAYGLSHEYTNALTGAMALEETLETLLPTTASPILSKLHSAHSRMADLTRDFILFHEGGSFAAPPLPLNELVDSVATFMSYVVNEQIDLTLDLDASLNGVEVETRGLEFPLALVLVRGRNAMEGKGSLALRTRLVHLTEEKQTEYLDLVSGDYATIAVTDQGGPPTELERAALSGSLSLGDAVSPEANSLWLAQEALNGLGGQIDLNGAPDGATSFTFFLPILAPMARPSHGRRKFHLLVVEDANILVQALQSALSRAGYDVSVATRGDQALMAPDISEIDLLIADVLLPGMNGVDLATRLRETKPGLRVILMSGQADRSHFEPAELPHAAVFLQKPFSMEVLLSAVNQLLRAPDLPNL